MALIDPIKDEFHREAASTRALLERVPETRFDWQPHAKSMTLGRLASHLAEIAGYGKFVIGQDELRFAPNEYKPRIAASTQELLQMHDKAVAETAGVLNGITDEMLGKTWTLYMGDKPAIQGPKIQILRGFAFNHMVHHRGQLTVYLRLLDVPLPSIYGPSADTQP